MKLTEAEARTKWCPHARGQEGQNRSTAGMMVTCRCIASDCFGGWRWLDPPGAGGVKTDDAGVSSNSERRGYCGLGGWARF